MYKSIIWSQHHFVVSSGAKERRTTPSNGAAQKAESKPIKERGQETQASVKIDSEAAKGGRRAGDASRTQRRLKPETAMEELALLVSCISTEGAGAGEVPRKAAKAPTVREVCRSRCC